jgi:hypothetical protein
VLLLIPAVLAYGYWHARTHATLYVSLVDASVRERYQPVKQAELSFKSASGEVVAKAGVESQYGSVYLAEPAEYACHEIERKAPFDTAARDEWSRCFKQQSRWLSSRVPDIASVEVVTGSCRVEVPAAFSSYSDWWLWWVPLPHVGGTPYWNYSLLIRIDPLKCTAT